MERPKRTNSLAFAKHDCHTCSATGQFCDRRRPQCGSCLAKGQKCGGFTMNLVWKELDNAQKSSNRHRHHLARHREASGELPRDRCSARKGFRFVNVLDTRKRRSRRPNGSLSRLSPMNEGSILLSQPEEPPSPARNSVSTGSEDYSELNEVADSFGFSEIETPSVVSSDPLCFVSPQIIQDLENEEESSPDPMPYLEVDEFLQGPDSLQGEESFSCAEETIPSFENSHQNLFEAGLSFNLMPSRSFPGYKYNVMLNLYDQELCAVPLTSDCYYNPFRIPTPRREKCAFLQHAVMAVAAHHIGSQRGSQALINEMRSHRSASFQLFTKSLCEPKPLLLLDTLVLLFNLEACQSAYGQWGIHLNGARKLLEQLESFELLHMNSRFRAQVGMIVWWDVTVALLSRRSPRLPLAYLENLIQYKDDDGWSFFTLNGCPIDFVMAMARLAELADTNEMTTPLGFKIIRAPIVEAIVQEVKSFVNPNGISLDDAQRLKEGISVCRYRYHCVEAWRHTILLYCCRVFQSTDDNSNQIPVIDHLASVILDHVRCIPEEEIIQKQLLLPVFLAAAELGEARNRAFAQDYCRHWAAKCRIYHFETTGNLLKDIWDDWDPLTRGVYWWGSKVKQPRRFDVNDYELEPELLLG